MKFEIIPAYEISLAEQAQVANESFAGYVGGWADLDPASLARFLLLQGSDLFYSRFIRCDDRLAGFGYINRTGDLLRLSGMGLIPAARGTGASSHLLDHLLGEARERGDRLMTLEVIQQNPAGVGLYRRHKFEEVDQLFGWRRAAVKDAEAASSGSLEELSVLDALRMPRRGFYPDIPWQISGYAVAKAERARGYRLADASVIVSDAGAGKTRILSLIAAGDDTSNLRALFNLILAHHPEQEFFAPAIWPQWFGREVFEPCGFAREPISQFFMRRVP